MKRVLLVAGLLAACRKEPIVGTGTQPDSSADVQSGVAGSAVLGARCRPTGQGMVIDDGPGAEELEVGDAVPHADGYAVGISHRTSAGRVAAVVLMGADGGGARVVDLGPTLGDGPPPRLAACHGTLAAAAFGPPRVRPHGNGPDLNRDLVLYAIDSAAPDHALASIPQHRDDSLAFDLACSGAKGLAVWDETAAATPGASPRGIVRAASFDPGGHAGPARDVSPPESDAEMPRVISTGAGFFVLWVARLPEATAISKDAPASSSARGRNQETPALEATGEARAHGWLEMIALDPAGNAAGPVRRLTPASGHVSAYDVALRFGAPSRTVLVVARDDEERGEGTGGVLLVVRARDDGIDRPLVLPTDGLGRGPPTFVESSAVAAAGQEAFAPWIAWVGSREQLRLLPLDASGEIAAAPSAEDALDEARPLVWVAGDARMLVAAPGDKTAQLRIFACRP